MTRFAQDRLASNFLSTILRKAGDLSQQPDFSFIDLFAGIGGLRRGFESIGGECVYSCEWNPCAQKTYRANFPHDTHDIAEDITKVDVASIPAHDVLLAGFSCQPFSIAGVSKKNALNRPHGFACDTQGTSRNQKVYNISADANVLEVQMSMSLIERYDDRIAGVRARLSLWSSFTVQGRRCGSSSLTSRG